MAKQKVLVIGFGNIAKAMFNGMDPKDSPYELTVVSGKNFKRGDSALPVTQFENISSIPDDYKPDMVVFAVQPTVLDQVLPVLGGKFKDQSPLYVTSVAARSLAAYQERLGKNAKIFRAMPNLLAEVGAGITLTHPSAACSADDVQKATALFSGQSEIIPCKKETDLDKLTATTGCTPGFLFEAGDALVKAMRNTLPEGVELTDAQLQAMGARLMMGAGKYAVEHPELTFADMAAKVGHKGGWTAAGLDAMRKHPQGLTTVFSDGINAADARGRELAAGRKVGE